jgi:hypothetical protein
MHQVPEAAPKNGAPMVMAEPDFRPTVIEEGGFPDE